MIRAAIAFSAAALLPIAVAAPLPENPLTKQVIGTWEYGSDASNAPLPPWGTATATLRADGKLTATFGAVVDPTVLGDVTGSYKVDGDLLRTTVLRGKGTATEAVRKDEMRVLKVTADQLHLAHVSDKEKRSFILRRARPAASGQ